MLLEEYKLVQPFWRAVWPHLVRLKSYISYHVVIPSIGVCPIQKYVYDIYIHMYIYLYT